MGEPSILLVCARDLDRALLSYVLSREGYQVTTVDSAFAAVEAAAAGTCELVVLDTAFWRGGDVDVLDTIQDYMAAAAPPVMLFGQPDGLADVKAGLAAGAVSWLHHAHFDVPSFLKKIRGALSAPARSRLEEPPTETDAEAGAADPQEWDVAEPPPEPVSRFRLTAQAVAAALPSLEELNAFEFSITDAVTTTCSKDQAAAHLTSIAYRDPMLALAMLSHAQPAISRGANGAKGTATDLAKAIEFAGAREVYQAAETVRPLDVDAVADWDAGRFWLHSLATSRIAQLISTQLRLGNPGEAATAGLLHDIGWMVLARYFPKPWAALRAAAADEESPSGDWERNITGTYHGELGAWVLQQFGLPEALQEVVRLHHTGTAARQQLKGSVRVLALIVQAADQIAGALFPADDLCTPFEPLEDEFRSALEHAGLDFARLLAEARKIIAELATELVLLFPSSTSGLYFTSRKPLGEVLYLAPAVREHDLVQSFLEVRAQQVHVLRKLVNPANSVPAVVNLTRITEMPRQIEVLTSLMAAGLMDKRRGVVLLPEGAHEVHRKMVTPNWHLLASPSHPALWVPWLSAPAAHAGAAKSPKQNADGMVTAA